MNPSTAQARVVVDELCRCGVTDVVLSPGSRSAGLAIALAEAESRGELRLHVRIDERVAGYLAVGLAKITGVPAAVVTTSGTAAVNVYPAVVEADYSGVPMLVLTADRPQRLRDIGANQTIRQASLYSAHVRGSIDMAPAADRTGEVRYWRSTIARSIAVATDAMRPGPVHINMAFDEPLVPDEGADIAWIEPLVGRVEQRPWTADARLVAGMSTPLDDILSTLDEQAVVPARGLIIVGDHDAEDAVDLIDDLADAVGWPVIGEPSANVGSCATALSHGALVLADATFVHAHAPEIVITVGRIGLSRALIRAVAEAPLHIAVDTSGLWSDPTRSADLVVTSVPLPPEEMEADEQWLAEWQRADLLASAAVEIALAGHGEVLTGAHVARIAAASVVEQGMLFVGPSWPVRHVLNFAATSCRDAVVLGNRGTSGIDGCISSAWGAALALQANGGGGAIALVGDTTFIYDSNALSVPAEELRPDLVIVVADNSGGGIFSTLEQGAERFASVFERVFGVDPQTDVVALAEAFGVEVHPCTSGADLDRAIASAQEAGGVHVVVAQTCSRGQEAQILRSVQQAVGEALATA